jgi:DNA-binding response OmpR family regulator
LGAADERSPAAVLVVDDDAGIRDVVSSVLRGAGYLTSLAEDGEAGWNALRLIRYDALITDHEMPRLTGLDLIKRMRASALYVPVILMSGRMPFDETTIRPLLAPGAMLKKPFSISDLMVKLTNLLIPMGPGAPVTDWQTQRVHGCNPSPDLAIDELE